MIGQERPPGDLPETANDEKPFSPLLKFLWERRSEWWVTFENWDEFLAWANDQYGDLDGEYSRPAYGMPDLDATLESLHQDSWRKYEELQKILENLFAVKSNEPDRLKGRKETAELRAKFLADRDPDGCVGDLTGFERYDPTWEYLYDDTETLYFYRPAGTRDWRVELPDLLAAASYTGIKPYGEGWWYGLYGKAKGTADPWRYYRSESEPSGNEKSGWVTYDVYESYKNGTGPEPWKAQPARRRRMEQRFLADESLGEKKAIVSRSAANLKAVKEQSERAAKKAEALARRIPLVHEVTGEISGMPGVFNFEYGEKGDAKTAILRQLMEGANDGLRAELVPRLRECEAKGSGPEGIMRARSGIGRSEFFSAEIIAEWDLAADTFSYRLKIFDYSAEKINEDSKEILKKAQEGEVQGFLFHDSSGPYIACLAPAPGMAVSLLYGGLPLFLSAADKNTEGFTIAWRVNQPEGKVKRKAERTHRLEVIRTSETAKIGLSHLLGIELRSLGEKFQDFQKPVDEAPDNIKDCMDLLQEWNSAILERAKTGETIHFLQLGLLVLLGSKPGNEKDDRRWADVKKFMVPAKGKASWAKSGRLNVTAKKPGVFKIEAMNTQDFNEFRRVMMKTVPGIKVSTSVDRFWEQ